MKRKYFIVYVLLFAAVLPAQAQRIARHTTESNNVYPNITMNDLISMYNTALVDWDRNMKLLSKVRDDYGEEGGVTFTIQNRENTPDGWCFVTKKPDAMEVVYNLGTNKKSLFTDLLADLKPYYVKDVDNNQVYSYKHLEDPQYIFLVNITADTEYVKMYVQE